MKMLRFAHQLDTWALLHSISMRGQLVQCTSTRDLANHYLVFTPIFDSLLAISQSSVFQDLSCCEWNHLFLNGSLNSYGTEFTPFIQLHNLFPLAERSQFFSGCFALLHLTFARWNLVTLTGYWNLLQSGC